MRENERETREREWRDEEDGWEIGEKRGEKWERIVVSG